MTFMVVDYIRISNNRKFRARWLEINGVFESPYCVISEKRYANYIWTSPHRPQLSDYQFRKTIKPQAELNLKIVLEFKHYKKINKNKVKLLICAGEGYPSFNDTNIPKESCIIIDTFTLDIGSEDIWDKGLFLRRLIREKELGYC